MSFYVKTCYFNCNLTIMELPRLDRNTLKHCGDFGLEGRVVSHQTQGRHSLSKCQDTEPQVSKQLVCVSEKQQCKVFWEKCNVSTFII